MIACKASPCRHERNDELVLQLRRLYIYTLRYVLFPQELKMSSRFKYFGDTYGLFRATHFSKLGFRSSIVSFYWCQESLSTCQFFSIAQLLLLVAHTITLENMDGILTIVHFHLFPLNCFFEKHC